MLRTSHFEDVSTLKLSSIFHKRKYDFHIVEVWNRVKSVLEEFCRPADMTPYP
ncbi:hypothetical protein QO003_002461 [Arthrobacter silviterrae]|nr:hypothetical protein [Arthrobacter silviterrae]